jgi:hypothetical protein
MILKQHNEDQNFLKIWTIAKSYLLANEVRDRHDVFVFSIERISRQYPEVLLDREMFLKTIGFIKILTGQLRSAVFKTLTRFVPVAKQK